MTCMALARRKGTGPPTKPGKEPKLTAQQQLLLKAIRPVEPPPPPSPAERERLRELMKRYSKLKRLQGIEMEKRRNEARRAMWAAIDAMPHPRRVEAVQAQADELPYGLPVFTHTPPIKGFDLSNLKNQ